MSVLSLQQESQLLKFQVIVISPPEDRMRFVRALRTVGAIGLKRAIDLAIHFDRFRRSVLVAGVELHVAEHLSAALREAGTEVELQECSISTPMLCTPEVNAKYVWGALRMLKEVA